MAKAATKQTTAKADTKAAKAEAKLPATVPELRAKLAEARRDHTLQKLESPIQLRALRRALARALTAEQAKRGGQDG